MDIGDIIFLVFMLAIIFVCLGFVVMVGISFYTVYIKKDYKPIDPAAVPEGLSLGQLIDRSEEIKKKWEEYEEKSKKIVTLNKITPQEYYRESELKARKLKNIQVEIENRFPDVITTRARLLEKAHLIATSSEEKKIQTLEEEMKRKSSSFASSYGGGYQYLENTQSAVLNGAVVSKVAGPVAGGLAYATTEAKNEQIKADNISRKVHNAVIDDRYDELKSAQKQLESYCISVVKGHDPDVTIYLF